MNSRYEMTIFSRDENQCFVAEVPELPGCMADGSTYQEAVTHAEHAIRDWIETAEKIGRRIPKPKVRLRFA